MCISSFSNVFHIYMYVSLVLNLFLRKKYNHLLVFKSTLSLEILSIVLFFPYSPPLPCLQWEYLQLTYFGSCP